MAELRARAIYNFERQHEDEISFQAGETLTIVSQNVGPGYEGWWMGRRQSGGTGYIPESFVELLSPPEPSMPPPPPPPYPASSMIPPSYAQANNNNNNDNTDNNNKFFADEEWSSDEDRGGGGARHRGSSSTSGGQAAWGQPAASAPPPPATAQQLLQQPGHTPTMRKSASATLSNASADAGPGAARQDARKSIRALPKVAGIREFLLTDETLDVIGPNAICVTSDGQEFQWQAQNYAISYKITDPSKASKMRGLKSYIAYNLCPASDPDKKVARRYKQFDWLHKLLAEKFPCIAVPPLPDRQITGRYEENFINTRMRQLQMWLNRMCEHPIVGPSLVFQHFLTCKDEGKQWKEGKRRAEQDKLSRGQIYHAVRVASHCELEQVERYTESFDAFANEIDSANKLALDTVLSYSKKCDLHIKKEYERIAGACFGLAKAASMVPNNSLDSLSQAMHVAGQSYQQVATLWAEQPRRDSDPLAEALHEYSGIISCLPALTSIGKGAVQTARECQRSAQEGRMPPEDAQKALERSSIVGVAQCAEMHHFRRGLARDYRAMMADFLREQVLFHQKIAEQLQTALIAFEHN